jgi:hypothetical protein
MPMGATLLMVSQKFCPAQGRLALWLSLTASHRSYLDLGGSAVKIADLRRILDRER